MDKASAQQKERLHKVEGTVASILLLGGIYALFIQLSGKGIPCLFRAMTGKLCPGCGMSHAMMALLKGEPSQAFAYNPLSVTVVPVLAFLLAYQAGRYIKLGTDEFTAGEIVLAAVLLVISIAYGIARNMP